MATTNIVLGSSDWTKVYDADGKAIVFERKSGVSGEYFYSDEEPATTDAGHELLARVAVSATPPVGVNVWVRAAAGVRVVLSVLE